MIDRELVFAPETSSSTELLPLSGDDSTSALESGIQGNNNTSAFSEPFSQDVTELSKTYEPNDNSLMDGSQQLVTTTATEADPLTGDTSVDAATLEPIYEFDSENNVTVDALTGGTKSVDLDYIKTVPSNIELLENDGTVPESDAPAAINGGFFNRETEELVSIAVNNNESVDPERFGESNNYGNLTRGTLYYDGYTNSTGVWPVSNIDELTEDPERIKDLNNYWAQGGISMGLKLPEIDYGLPQQTIEELNQISPTEETQRTALIHDNLPNNRTGETGSEVYLVTTEDEVTLGEFRAAIKQTFTDSEGVARGDAEVDVEGGIFLDGGGSTQIKADDDFEYSDTENRDIPQIIALKSVE